MSDPATTDSRSVLIAIVDAPFDAALSERYPGLCAVDDPPRARSPILRDGLKPVHRRLLWTMRQLKL